MSAQIKFVQGVNAPVSGRALQGVTGVLVTASDGSGDAVSSYGWAMLDVPPGSSVLVGSLGGGATVGFTPDIVGGYLVQLTTNVSGVITSDLRAVLVPEDVTYTRFIAPLSADVSSLNINGQTRGWAPFMESYLHVLDRLRDVASVAPHNGDTLTWDSLNSRYSPAPASAR